jgi:hypothetical protein
MITALIALSSVTSGAVATPQIAFIARFYYPYPDKRISRGQVYISDIDGKNRKQLTSGNREPASLEWVGKKKLCWVETQGGKDRLVIYDIATKKVKPLLTRQSLYRHGAFDLFTTEKHPEYTDDSFIYRVTESGIKELGKVRSRDSAFDPNAMPTWQFAGEPTIRLVGYRDDAGILKQEPGYYLPKVQIRVFERADRRYEWTLSGGFFEFYSGDKMNTSYLHSLEGGGSAGTWESLLEANWSTGKLRPLVSDVYGIGVRRGSRYWSAEQAGRILSMYGPEKQVWTGEAYVGDFQTGKRWTIATGLVYVYEITVQP